jgi:hypothetical protein
MTPERWLAALVLVNVLDAALTLYALKLGGSEGNPLLGALMRRVHPALVLAVTKGAYIVLVGALLPAVASWLPWMTAFFVAVCAWNVVQIRRLRKTTPA